MNHYTQYRNQKIGLKIQENVACIIERELRQFKNQSINHIPDKIHSKIINLIESPHFLILSNGTNGADLLITNQEDIYIECEVKTCKELFYHRWIDKKTQISHKELRRGMFNVKPEQLKYDLFIFVIRFVDVSEQDCFWNGDIEVFYALGKDVKAYLEKQILNCENYKLHINKLPRLYATENLFNHFYKIL